VDKDSLNWTSCSIRKRNTSNDLVSTPLCWSWIDTSKHLRLEATVQGIQKLWEIKDLGEVQQILGLQVHRNRGLRTITIDQTEYIHRAVQRFGMGSAKPVTLPVSDRNTLVSGSTTEIQADQALFQQAIGSLMWVAKGTRFDIAYAVGQLSQHCNAP
jgi:hypothetical protein